jgi:hypothetical protein
MPKRPLLSLEHPRLDCCSKMFLNARTLWPAEKNSAIKYEFVELVNRATILIRMLHVPHKNQTTHVLPGGHLG